MRGTVNAGENITVRLDGGKVGDYEEFYDTVPTLTEGEEYLMFLYQPKRGGGYNTEGDYYYVLGLIQGVFSRINDEVYQSQSGEKINFSDIAERCKEAPVDELYFRNEFIKNQELNNEFNIDADSRESSVLDYLDEYAKIIDNPEMYTSDSNYGAVVSDIQ